MSSSRVRGDCTYGHADRHPLRLTGNCRRFAESHVTTRAPRPTLRPDITRRQQMSQERWDRRPIAGHYAAGLLLIALGTLFLLRNLGVPVPGMGKLWPLFLVAVGALKWQQHG